MILGQSLQAYIERNIKNIQEISEDKKSNNSAITIYKAYDIQSNQNVIIKEFDLLRDQFDEYQTEITSYENLNHNNIISPVKYGIIDEDGQMHGFIILPYVKGGDLFSALKTKIWEYKENDFIQFAYHLISVIDYIHSKGIIHRDLKHENILLEIVNIQPDTFSFNPSLFRIIDFGSSIRNYDENSNTNNYFRNTFEYIPPEYINSKTITYKYDIFSAGIILYVLITGEFPNFEYDYDNNNNAIEFYQYNIDEYFYQAEWEYVSEEIKDLIKSTLTYDYNLRPDANRLLKFKIFSGQKILVNIQINDCND